MSKVGFIKDWRKLESHMVNPPMYHMAMDKVFSKSLTGKNTQDGTFTLIARTTSQINTR